MKILILLSRQAGGVGRVIRNVKKELELRGHEVGVVNREDDLKMFSFFNSFFKLRKEIKKQMSEDYDIIYTQDWSMSLPLIFPIPIYGDKHFCCFHGNQSWISGLIQKIVGKVMGERLIVVGPQLKARFPKSHLVYNGVSFETFKDLGKRRTKIGWIDKGSEAITKDEFLEIAKKYKLEPSIAKDILPEKMNEWYNSLKVFVSYPSKIAGFNLCWLEAKAAGVPEILGNEEGVGIKKVERDWNKMSWKSHVKDLIEIWKNQRLK